MPLASKKLRKILKKIEKIPETLPSCQSDASSPLGLPVVIGISVLVNAGTFLWVFFFPAICQFEKSLRLYPSITPITLATVNQPHFTMRFLRAQINK